jgi:mannose-1-phosphate guanylyltransferase
VGSHEYAVILAGGGGTRLWPVSRKAKPKQFQLLIGDKSLLQMMYELLAQHFDRDRIFVQSVSEYLPYIEAQLPHIAPDRIIVEPEPRDTAPAFAFAAATLARHDPDAVLGIFYADNVVFGKSKEQFYQGLREGFDAISHFPDRVVMMGVRPLYPHTGLGYIEVGARVNIPGHRLALFDAKSFREKPDLQTARELAASPDHLWNTGYKILRAQHALRLLASSHPAYAEHIPALAAAVARGDTKAIAAAFTALPRQSFEYLITETATNLLASSLDVDWSDLGDWEIVHRILAQDQGEGLYTAGQIVKHGCKDTLLISHHRPVIAVGVQDLVVIETKDAVLVMSKERSQDLKMVLQELQLNEPELL